MGALDIAVTGVAPHGERHAIRGGSADQRRAAHLHIADRHRRRFDGLQALGLEGMRQFRLVDDFHRPAVLGKPNRSVIATVNFHPWTMGPPASRFKRKADWAVGKQLIGWFTGRGPWHRWRHGRGRGARADCRLAGAPRPD